MGQHSGSRSYGLWRRHTVPIAVWLLAVVCAGGLLRQRAASVELVGMARGRVAQVSAPYAARLKRVAVRIADRVAQGQIVAQLDDAVLVAQIATIRGEIQRLQAEFEEAQSVLDADIKNRESEWVAEHRAFLGDEIDLHLKVLELQALLDYDRALLRDLRLEMDNVKAMVDAEALAPYEYEKARLLHDSLSDKVKANQRFLEQTQRELELAKTRTAEFQEHQPIHPARAIALDQVRKAIGVQEGLIQELEAQRAEYVLRAPCSGVVIDIQGRADEAMARRPGEGVARGEQEVIAVGDPVLAIAELEPNQILAYARDDQCQALQPGSVVELKTLRRPAQLANAEVVAVIPTFERMPERLWPNPALPTWGRPVLINLPPGLALAPGELVRVRQPRTRTR